MSFDIAMRALTAAMNCEREGLLGSAQVFWEIADEMMKVSQQDARTQRAASVPDSTVGLDPHVGVEPSERSKQAPVTAR